MRIIRYIYTVVFLTACFCSCKKWDDYKKYVPDGEKIYPSIAETIMSHSGNNRIQLLWEHTTDPNVLGYKVFWNNSKDSLVITNLPKPQEVVSVIIPVVEGVYDFVIRSFDNKGRLSVQRIAPGVRSYGENYQSGLFNRGLANPSYYFRLKDNIQLNFNDAVSNEENMVVKFTNQQNKIDSVVMGKQFGSTVFLDNYKKDTEILYRSGFKPNSSAIDIFYNSNYSIVNNIQYNYRDSYAGTGKREDYDATGKLVSSTAINMNKQIVKTATVNNYFTDDLANLANYAPAEMFLKLNTDNTIDVSGKLNGVESIVNHPNAPKSHYDVVTGEIYLNYKYTNADGTYRLINEVLKPI